MSKKYDVVAVTGTYKDQQGQEKRRYQTIGAVFTTQNGFGLKIESIPVGWDGFAYLNEPRARDAAPPARQSNPAPQQRAADFDDDIPFAFAFLAPLAAAIFGALVMAGGMIA